MGAGAIVALIGIWADANWLVNVAIVLLLVGFLLRFVGGRSVEEEQIDADGPQDTD
jgi:multisubunit Na+/H+ antiporter MnhF subunit